MPSVHHATGRGHMPGDGLGFVAAAVHEGRLNKPMMPLPPVIASAC